MAVHRRALAKHRILPSPRARARPLPSAASASLLGASLMHLRARAVAVRPGPTEGQRARHSLHGVGVTWRALPLIAPRLLPALRRLGRLFVGTPAALLGRTFVGSPHHRPGRPFVGTPRPVLQRLFATPLRHAGSSSLDRLPAALPLLHRRILLGSSASSSPARGASRKPCEVLGSTAAFLTMQL